MAPNTSPRLYITFHEKAGIIRRAIIPLRSTYQEAVLDTLKTYGLPEDHENRYDFKYGRKMGEAIVWMELLPKSWNLVDDGDDLLLCARQEVGLRTTAMESSATLVPDTNGGIGVGMLATEDAQETKRTFKQAARPIVRYRYAKVVKGLEQSVAFATSLLPDTYKEAAHTAVSALKQNTIGADLEVDGVLLWARILDERGNRISAAMPPEQFLDIMREMLNKDPNCSIAVIPLRKA